MKKTLAILLISLGCVLIALLLYKITAKLQSNSDRRAAVSSIPELPIVSISGDVSDLKDIATPMVLVLASAISVGTRLKPFIKMSFHLINIRLSS
jgi:hypothetical protein